MITYILLGNAAHASEDPQNDSQKLTLNPQTSPSSQTQDYWQRNSYFEFYWKNPAASCFEGDHPLNVDRKSRVQRYANPWEFCTQNDDIQPPSEDWTNFHFNCYLEDCRIDPFTKSLQCPKVPVFNCAALMCVKNRSEREKERYEEFVQEEIQKQQEKKRQEAQKQLDQLYPYDPLKTRPAL